MGIFSHFRERFETTRREEYSLQEYLDLCKRDKTAYTSTAERLLMTVGKPELLDTSVDSKLLRVLSNKVIRRYPAFADLRGVEECIDQIVAFFRHATQGLEGKKQILYLLGPAGGDKSSLAEKFEQLMEKVPFYTIGGSPVFESPLDLLNPDEDGTILEEDYGIPRCYLRSIMSPWATKHLSEFGSDISQFRVVEPYPSILNQIAIAKAEPSDENSQDISALVGKVDIRKLEEYPQNGTNAYSYSGALCQANRGLMEFVETFKTPIKVLHPLLAVTQEGNHNSAEGPGALPYSGIILTHSNESEQHSFRNNKNDGAFIDRIYIVKVPYCLRVADEIKVYDKLLVSSSLAHAHCAPDILKMLLQFSVLPRLKEPKNSNIYSKIRIYDGENLKDTDPKAESIQEYRDSAEVDGDAAGLSIHFAFRILSKVSNFDPHEVAANPVHLLYVLERQIEQEQLQSKTCKRYLRFTKKYLTPHYVEFVGKEIQTAYLKSYSEYGQNIFDHYVLYAGFWIQDQEYRDPEASRVPNRAAPNEELEKAEKPTGISNPRDFRNEIVSFVLRARAGNNGKNPGWLFYEKLRIVIEKGVFSNTEDLFPVISLNAKANEEDQQKHNDLVKRMVERGYTERQVRLLSEWYLRARKSQ